MKKLLLIFACMATLAYWTGCVGQKDDPEPDDPQPVEPVDPEEPKEQDDPVDPVEEVVVRSLVLNFTGTWCVNCPRMHTAIEEAMEENPDILVPVSVHCLPIDPMCLSPESTDLVNRFGISAYPSVVVDLDPSTLFTVSSSQLLMSHVEATQAARGKASAIKVEVTDDGAVNVEAKVASDGDYTLHLILLEDGIVSPQTGPGDDYVHNDVLRAWLDAPETFTSRVQGDTIRANFPLEEVSDAMRAFALLCRNGLVDNLVPCTFE